MIKDFELERIVDNLNKKYKMEFTYDQPLKAFNEYCNLYSPTGCTFILCETYFRDINDFLTMNYRDIIGKFKVVEGTKLDVEFFKDYKFLSDYPHMELHGRWINTPNGIKLIAIYIKHSTVDNSDLCVEKAVDEEPYVFTKEDSKLCFMRSCDNDNECRNATALGRICGKLLCCGECKESNSCKYSCVKE